MDDDIRVYSPKPYKLEWRNGDVQEQAAKEKKRSRDYLTLPTDELLAYVDKALVALINARCRLRVCCAELRKRELSRDQQNALADKARQWADLGGRP